MAAHEAQGADDPTVATYTATYRVVYKGKEAGTAEFSVRYLADHDLYEFSSRVIGQGLLKLARPNPAVERSQFRVDANGIQPLEFWYEDGSRSGEDNFTSCSIGSAASRPSATPLRAARWRCRMRRSIAAACKWR